MSEPTLHDRQAKIKATVSDPTHPMSVEEQFAHVVADMNRWGRVAMSLDGTERIEGIRVRHYADELEPFIYEFRAMATALREAEERTSELSCPDQTDDGTRKWDCCQTHRLMAENSALRSDAEYGRKARALVTGAQSTAAYAGIIAAKERATWLRNQIDTRWPINSDGFLGGDFQIARDLCDDVVEIAAALAALPSVKEGGDDA